MCSIRIVRDIWFMCNMLQLCPRVLWASLFPEWVSGVSFAADTPSSHVLFMAVPRLSGDTCQMRAFHSTYIPPVPVLPSDNVSNDGVK
ncbi:uncharacterized protein LACBIDRAFT_297831 [Laccaria bicolor S238N-H82]|uniref:Predicted protein n=1 Tax=Laccaria bicolor (strain S238N-H82 / ATCC MYA-4686) TaxID=486041 RepID=B0DB01_LACBS|nr:uncharacterized protein LACBIDRAFT_297831 [Laccaria bicolor S238N-H82]EDR08296.1 predicted protein [Laccaria bicolor S238N-H82]|eukprot:XP_001881366.1 predicted protein [Laccaria bicolor S238N-H82]